MNDLAQARQEATDPPGPPGRRLAGRRAVGGAPAPPCLLVPRVRRGLGPTWRSPGRRRATSLVGGVVVAIPDGRLPIPPGPGLLVTPSYVGSPATPQPLGGGAAEPVPGAQRNQLDAQRRVGLRRVRLGRSARSGPRGRHRLVRHRGVRHARLHVGRRPGRACAGTSRGRRCTCSTPRRCTSSTPWSCPGRPGGRDKQPWEDLCAGAYFYLDDQDRAVVATTDRAVRRGRHRRQRGDRSSRGDAHDLAGECRRTTAWSR